jgi:hypothetical protein
MELKESPPRKRVEFDVTLVDQSTVCATQEDAVQGVSKPVSLSWVIIGLCEIVAAPGTLDVGWIVENVSYFGELDIICRELMRCCK